MQVVLGGLVIFAMFASYKIKTVGLHNLERKAARWLLIDAASWEAKGKAKLVAQKKIKVA